MERVKLKDIATYINGKAFKPSEWVESGLPIIRIQNLNNPSKEYNYYDKDVDVKYIIENGDILISWSATLDIFEWKREKALLNQHIFKVVFDKDIDLDKNYFKLAISSVLHDMERFTHGSTMKHIVKKDFENIEIPLPPLPKQKAIAQKLDLARKLIELRKESITKLEVLARSVFVEMFGDPVENPKKYKAYLLDELTHRVTDGEHQTPKRTDKGTLLLSARNIQQGYIDIYNEKVDYIGEDEVIRIHRRLKIEKNDILLSCSGTIGRVSLNTLNQDFCLVRSVAVIKSNEDMIIPKFLVEYLQTNFMQTNMKMQANAAGQPNLFQKQIKKLKIYLPPITLQNKFAQTIQKIEAQKTLYKAELVKLEESFEGLLQESFG